MLGSWRPWAVAFAAMCSTAAMPPISEQARAALDRTMGAKGVYVTKPARQAAQLNPIDVLRFE